ncbi:related to BSC1 Transcript encoded by this ORF shows a high level of stop codon bypass [Cephalotrichum gorgonifer]|uniref:Related to BSC1 Transcript encoded by this ORF shows a high level of stop codon bypass n=1 Tax=Cephalotrichum gorgonifer TaxID=2041049 RepID=A0AAE8SRK5_9PEZI|nr:related to BSC1 Transcript encoded by this ORF shows a high level of stop codon bypass [Cephalotrichum gorgonifer]
MARIRTPHLSALCFLGLLFSHHISSVSAQDGTDTTSTSSSTTIARAGGDGEDKDVTILVGTKTIDTSRPSDIYQTFTSRITLSPESTESLEPTVTFTGSQTSATFGGNGTETSGAPVPTNTQPCNNYVELCERKYSNITVVGAHNSPFVREGSSASNQQLDVITQLNDGVRFLQAQIQFPSDGGGPHFCHTSCDMLDAGPIEDWLTRVREWVDSHPYDVVTILLGNGNYSNPDLYAPHIEASGIVKYAYRPRVLPMRLDDWPTLSEMIIHGKRFVMFLDYNANQTAYPWLLDEFSQMSETPFDPVDDTFPCVVQRPPDLSDDAAKDRLFLLNHNLNAEVTLFGTQILLPAVSLLNRTNGESGYGSLGNSTAQCAEKWGRAPNVLNTDYYNFGDSEGSVFKVAARFNNVTYNGQCCGRVVSGAAYLRPLALPLVVAVIFSALMA